MIVAMIRHAVQSGFSRIAEALGDPAREAMVSALAQGRAMPAGELAAIAGVSPQSASAHLQKLVDARVLAVWAQGRFRYYRIADDDVAAVIESLVDLATKTDLSGHRRAHIAEELRQVRSCYCHLAGRLGVLLSETLLRRKFVTVQGRNGSVTEKGLAWCAAERIAFDPQTPKIVLAPGDPEVEARPAMFLSDTADPERRALLHVRYTNDPAEAWPTAQSSTCLCCVPLSRKRSSSSRRLRQKR